MPRGEPKNIGDWYVSKNGYVNIKTENGWKPKHHVIAEEKLGRPLNKKTERVIFADGDRTNFATDNIIIVEKKEVSKATRRAQLETRRDELQAEIDDLEDAG